MRRGGLDHQRLRERQDRPLGQAHDATEQQQAEEAADQPGQRRAQREQDHRHDQQRLALPAAVGPGADQRAGYRPGQGQHRGEHAQVAVAQLQLLFHEGKQEGQRQAVEEDEAEGQEQHAEQDVFVTGGIVVMRHVGLQAGRAGRRGGAHPPGRRAPGVSGTGSRCRRRRRRSCRSARGTSRCSRGRRRCRPRCPSRRARPAAP